MRHSIPAVLSCAAIATSASAGLTQFVFELDSFYALDPAAASLTDSSGSTVFEWHFAQLTDRLQSNGGSGFYFVDSLDLGFGTYTLTMTDGHYDGWNDSTRGGNTIGGAVVTNGQGFLTGKNFWGGYSTSVNFTLVPAPGAIALLGLSAFCGNRRRRTA